MSKKIPSNFNLLSNPKAVSFFPTNIFILRNKDYHIDVKFDSEVDYEMVKTYDFVHCSFWFQCQRCIRQDRLSSSP